MVVWKRLADPMFVRLPLHALVGLGALLLATCAASAGTASDEPPFVIQLFTSQGCASCPPADKLLKRLAQDPKVVALSFPVNYWDYMGWKDTFARPEFSVLQERYAQVRGDNHVYTPQAVIDGLAHVVGSDRGLILRAARTVYHDEGALTVGLKLKTDSDHMVAEIGDATTGARSGMIWLVRFARHESVNVLGGDNKGRTLTYANVVRSISPIARWKGQAKTIDLPPKDLDDHADAFAVLLQAGTQMRPGAILGAAVGSAY